MVDKIKNSVSASSDTLSTTTISLTPAAVGTVPRKARWSMSPQADRLFVRVTQLMAAIVLLLIVALLVQMLYTSRLSLSQFGLGFIWSGAWNPVKRNFGALPFIYGTLVTATIALVLALPISLSIAIFLNESCPFRLRPVIASMIELLAAIPSVAYGLWGIFVLVPIMRRYLAPFLGKVLGFLPLFQGTAYGVGLLTASLVLAIMIIPIIMSVSNNAIMAVPPVQKEAALALGATRWEATKMVLLNARSGIMGAVILALGRALGETMAVTMVIGNRPQISASLFAPGYTMASVIANEFTEATEEIYLQALIEIGVILFLVTFIVRVIAQLLIQRASANAGNSR
jgi:phosphate transport system permease protein